MAVKATTKTVTSPEREREFHKTGLGFTFLLVYVLNFTLFMNYFFFVILNFIIALYVFYGVELLIPAQFMLFQLNYWSYFFSSNSYSPIFVDGLYNCIYNIGWT